MKKLKMRFLVTVMDGAIRRGYADALKEDEEPWSEMVALSVKEVLNIKLKRLIRERVGRSRAVR